MKERFEKTKKFVKEHTEELIVAVLATLAVSSAVILVKSAQNDLEDVIDDPED